MRGQIVVGSVALWIFVCANDLGLAANLDPLSFGQSTLFTEDYIHGGLIEAPIQSAGTFSASVTNPRGGGGTVQAIVDLNLQTGPTLNLSGNSNNATLGGTLDLLFFFQITGPPTTGTVPVTVNASSTYSLTGTGTVGGQSSIFIQNMTVGNFGLYDLFQSVVPPGSWTVGEQLF